MFTIMIKDLSARRVLFFFEVKTSLDALSKYFVGIELVSGVTLVRVESARVTAI